MPPLALAASSPVTRITQADGRRVPVVGNLARDNDLRPRLFLATKMWTLGTAATIGPLPDFKEQQALARMAGF